MPDISLWPVQLLLGLQCLLLASFAFSSFFNYLYAAASLLPSTVRSVPPSNRRIAVVVVAYNEEHVLESTLAACDRLTFENKLIVLADDSSEPQIVEAMRDIARVRGCIPLPNHGFVQEEVTETGERVDMPIEIWTSPGFIYFHRPSNRGFKGGSLRKVQEWLEHEGIEFMYLLDADWQPQSDALERTLGVLEANPDVAFVQTKRLSMPAGMNRFQRYVSLAEDGCYQIDFVGRQALGHPILFSGCCTLFRMQAVAAVGGFAAGHLTEDLDLTNRFWLTGWKGIYLESVVNYGEVPFTFEDYRRQQERWASGSARALREHGVALMKTRHLSWSHKLAALRQNGYFVTALLAAAALLLGVVTSAWLAVCWNSHAVEWYLFTLERFRIPIQVLVYGCLLANFVEPVLMILVKRRNLVDLIHLPMMIWYAWGVIPTYAAANIKGFLGRSQRWFRTPKFKRGTQYALERQGSRRRSPHLFWLMAAVWLYGAEAYWFGWFDTFALLIVPAFLLAVVSRFEADHR